jgi:uncharacterized membrane protein YhaH (DUF805 family)
MSSPYQPYPQEPSGGYGQQQPGYGQQGGYGQAPYPPQGGWEPSQRGYLQGGPVGFGEAISEAFKNIFTFRGRASRSAFWWFTLFAIIIDVVFAIIAVAAKITVLMYIVEVVIGIVTIGLQVRRLHDSGRSGWWWWIGIIPIIGGIVLLVFDCLPGTPGPNKYDV